MTLPFEFAPLSTGLPWIGGDLQTLRNWLTRAEASVADWSGEAWQLTLADGDRLSGTLYERARTAARPLVVIVHGLTGSETGINSRSTARAMLAAGYPVLTLNMRGAGSTAPWCRSIYHAGRSEDLAEALSAIAAAGLAPRGTFWVGYSLGANILLNMMGDLGDDSRVIGAVSVSAPIDMLATSKTFLKRRNRIYHNWLLAEMKRGVRILAEPVPEALLSDVRTTVDYDEKVVAPIGGYRGAEDYYRRTSALGRLNAIRRPTLLIHAQDDPWIPAAPYLAYDWKSAPALAALLPCSGGHVGFHDRGRRKAGGAPWHDRAAIAFLGFLGY
ncbi:YheT family hydrolase [Radicibacter daui]|uniref:YheT family hydrolase n=1 Tax=Radicibacter daui TaxID=3064829 RepID=UPI004046D5E5